MVIYHRSERENISGPEFLQNCSLRKRAKQVNPVRQVQLSNSFFQITAQRAVANDFASELKASAREIGARVDQVLKSFEGD
ncbi:MAG: hypothetical protein DME64_14875 [Verrucomicrobia bacterium]|nr:MAG: hypothetical protein DME64_14875 [Verrucomicrobiota bacterium]